MHSTVACLWKKIVPAICMIWETCIGLEWNTKLGSIGGEVLRKALASAAYSPKKIQRLVIANEGHNLSAGANVGQIFMLAAEQECSEQFYHPYVSKPMMRVRYSAIPVGGCLKQHLVA